MKPYSAIAPAKINLELRVKKLKHGQTKHDVKNLMQTISLHDTLTIKCEGKALDNSQVVKQFAKNSISLDIKCLPNGLQEFECNTQDNLITKAILGYFQTFAPNQNHHFDIRLEKNIPTQAGLGGGSSDAAAALQIMCKMFNTNPTSTKILNIASSIGADVPYFLKGGKREMTSSGEVEAASFESLNSPLVLIKPQTGVSTKEAYQLFDECDASSLKTPSIYQNDLQTPAIKICPEIKRILDTLPQNASMSGSGSCVFYICKTFEQASTLAAQAKKNGWWSRACSAVNIGAHVI